MLTAERKQQLILENARHEGDTGSPEVQIAVLSERIKYLTEHLKANHKDFGTQKAMIKLLGKRRALLDYLKDRDIERYRAIIKALNIRK